MKVLKLSRIISVSLLIMFGCGQAYEKTEIDVPDSVKQALEEAAPQGNYRFFAVKESLPENIGDLQQAVLFACGEIEGQADLQVLMASMEELNSPLFKSINRFYINQNMVSGQMAMAETVTVNPENGEALKIPRAKSVFGTDNTSETLVGKCVEEMQKNPKSVLLISSDIKSEALRQMAKVIFK